MRASLRIPVFRRLLAAFAFNELAWSVGTLALAVLVYRCFSFWLALVPAFAARGTVRAIRSHDLSPPASPLDRP